MTYMSNGLKFTNIFFTCRRVHLIQNVQAAQVVSIPSLLMVAFHVSVLIEPINAYSWQIRAMSLRNSVTVHFHSRAHHARVV